MQDITVAKNKDKLVITNTSKEKIVVKKVTIYYPTSIYLGSGSGQILTSSPP